MPAACVTIVAMMKIVTAIMIVLMIAAIRLRMVNSMRSICLHLDGVDAGALDSILASTNGGTPSQLVRLGASPWAIPQTIGTGPLLN